MNQALVAVLAAGVLAPGVVIAQIPSGYAFDKPRVLAQQLVWGRLHGVRALALACRNLGDGRATSAYLQWLESQSSPIAAAELALSRHYFGIDAAPMEAIDGALGLQPALDLPTDEMTAGCQTLPEALAAPRNQLGQYYLELRRAIQSGDPRFQGIVRKEE